MLIGFLRIFAIVCAAFVCGKLISKVKLPAILGWLIAGIVAKYAFKWAGEIDQTKSEMIE